MNDYRYILEKYSGPGSRHTCPVCQIQRVFVKYIDVHNGQYVHESVGRCNRQDKCGYHYPPSKFFANNNGLNNSYTSFQKKMIVPKKYSSPSYIPMDILEASLTGFDSNSLVRYLMNRFGKEITTEAINKYFIGTSELWPGATLFWQIDNKGKVRTGKIMLYNSDTGKRIKEPYNHISWVHNLENYKDFNLTQCFFGEHLIQGNTKPVAIVESEKTAIVASIYLPDFTWLSSGGKEGLSVNKYKVLRGRKVILFPDLNAFDSWSEKAIGIEKKYPSSHISVSDLLEKNGSSRERNEGWDIADYLLNNGVSVSIESRKKKSPEYLFWNDYNLSGIPFSIN